MNSYRDSAPRQATAGGRAMWLAALLCLSAACSSQQDKGFLPRTRVTGPSWRNAPSGAPKNDPLFFSRSANVVKLAGAINETLAFAFVLSAAEGPATGLEIDVEDIQAERGRIPRRAVRIYRHWPITVERYPNWYLRSQGLRQRRAIPDVLVPISAPIGGQPFNLVAGSSLPLWIEIRIPPDASPGLYRTALVVRDARGRLARTPVEITVHDIYLSVDTLLPVLSRVQLGPILAEMAGVDPLNLRLALADEGAREIIRQVFRLLHEHGLSPYTDEIHPRFRQNIDGAVVLDWDDYDAFCAPLIDGGAYVDRRPAYAWPLPADLVQPAPAQYDGLRSTTYAAVLKDYLTQSRNHFAERGWLDRAYVRFGLSAQIDPSADDVALIRRLATVTHLADRHLAFVSTLIPQPMTGFGWFGHHDADLSDKIDIWCTPARYQHAATLRRERTLGKRTWLLPDRPPFSGSLAVEAPPIHARSLGWQAFLQEHEAIALDHVTNWSAQGVDAPIRDRRQSSDTWLIYPGRAFGLNEPIPSVRLKQLQLGLQDYQYLCLLAAHGRAETARLLVGSLIKATGTDGYGDNYQDALFDRRVEAPELWELARSILVSELVDALAEEARPAPADPARQAAWVRFLSTTRLLRAWPESARLTVHPESKQGGFLITYNVAVRNELRTPVEGTLTFGPLPATGRAVSDIVRVGPLAEMGLARLELVAGSSGLPARDLDGHHEQKIIFDAGTAGQAEITATTAIVQVPKAALPIRVDGDLGDWPPSESNIAGDFRLINGCVTATGARRRAENQTVAYFCADEKMLYIGIHAGLPEAANEGDRTPSFSNVVAYEDLMPVGGDLVEILIDPTNSGTQSDDLFHIVLQSTGNPVFERGIDTTPPIGRRRPWPGRLPSYCVTVRDGGWTAEVAIPIDAFGPDARNNPIWGVNLARLEPQRGEYSDWARALRYCYDPRTLGNMVWPE